MRMKSSPENGIHREARQRRLKPPSSPDDGRRIVLGTLPEGLIQVDETSGVGLSIRTGVEIG
jgi:hypothetical protein